MCKHIVTDAAQKGSHAARAALVRVVPVEHRLLVVVVDSEALRGTGGDLADRAPAALQLVERVVLLGGQPVRALDVADLRRQAPTALLSVVVRRTAGAGVRSGPREGTAFGRAGLARLPGRRSLLGVLPLPVRQRRS